MAQPRSARYRLVHRILLGLLAALLLAGAGFAWWATRYGKAWLDRTVRARIEAAVGRACETGYHFNLTELRTDAWAGSLVISGASLGYDSTLVDSLRAGRFRYLFAARAARLELRGLSYWRLLLRGEFHANAIELVRPEISYSMGRERVSLAAPFNRLDGNGPLSIRLLDVDTLVVRRASGKVVDRGGHLPQMDLAGLDVRALDLQLSTGEQRGQVGLTVNNAEIDLDSLNSTMPDGASLRIGRTHLSHGDRKGSVEQIFLRPASADSSDTNRLRTTVVALSVTRARMEGLDLAALLEDQSLAMRHLYLEHVELDASLDKLLPPADPTPTALPTAALRSWNFSVQVDSLSLIDVDLAYHERDANTQRWGHLLITDLDASCAHVSNLELYNETLPPIEASFTGLLYDSAVFAGSYIAQLDGSDRFNVSLGVQGLPFAALDQMVGPLLRLNILGGTLMRLDLDIQGNDDRAQSTLAMDYQGLLVRVEEGTPAAMRHNMFGSVLETMQGKVYGGGLSSSGSKKYTVRRDKERSVLTYLWHVLREGLVRNLKPEAVERMRSMLRTDMDSLREQRAQRRSRKGK